MHKWFEYEHTHEHEQWTCTQIHPKKSVFVCISHNSLRLCGSRETPIYYFTQCSRCMVCEWSEQITFHCMKISFLAIGSGGVFSDSNHFQGNAILWIIRDSKLVFNAFLSIKKHKARVVDMDDKTCSFLSAIPHPFPFRLKFILICISYSVSNSSDTVSTHKLQRPKLYYWVW